MNPPDLPITPGRRGLSRAFLMAVLLVSGTTALQLLGMPPGELRQRMDRGDKLTIIDVRSAELYAKGHIPGAINIPAQVAAAKRLPALGDVVVYGEGLGRDSIEAARAHTAISGKPGIRAMLLDGGYAAWDAAQLPTTVRAGLAREELTFITYDQLKRSTDKLVLVDLRNRSSRAKSRTAPAEPLTDLAKEFPQFSVVKDIGSASAKAAGGAQPVLVLIDRNDGTSEDLARSLRSQGRKQVVVLAGGEEIIARGGRPGLERLGPGGTGNVNPPGNAGTTK